MPLIVVSPWTKGGWVNSQTFDHTSVIRLLETRFGVAEPQHHPLAAGGDRRPDQRVRLRRAPTGPSPPPCPTPPACRRGPRPSRPCPGRKPPASPEPLPRQEPGQRPARALPYAFDRQGAADGAGLALAIANDGAAGAGFNLYPAAGEAGPWFYTVEAGKRVEDVLPLEAGGYDLTLFGPNGFLRGFRGAAAGAEVEARYDGARERLVLTIRNEGPAPLTLNVADAYAKGGARTHRLAPGAAVEDAWPIKASAHWYDIAVTAAEDPTFLRRLAGHVETGRPSLSDPALG